MDFFLYVLNNQFDASTNGKKTRSDDSFLCDDDLWSLELLCDWFVVIPKPLDYKVCTDFERSESEVYGEPKPLHYGVCDCVMFVKIALVRGKL